MESLAGRGARPGFANHGESRECVPDQHGRMAVVADFSVAQPIAQETLMRIAFVLGSVHISGGNYVVVQHALHAAACGHEVSLVILYRFQPSDLAWHTGLAQLTLIHIDDIDGQRFDMAVATWCRRRVGSRL